MTKIFTIISVFGAGARSQRAGGVGRWAGVWALGLLCAVGCQARVEEPASVAKEDAKPQEAAPKAIKPHLDPLLPGMVRVLEGSFKMGSNPDPLLKQEHEFEYLVKKPTPQAETPMNDIYVSTFWIDQHEVTVDQYRACVEAQRCSEPDTKGRLCAGERTQRNNWTQKRGDHPVNCVSWEQADAYCRWAEKRLPTEAEWEKAARGVDGRRYPWGDQEPTCEHAASSLESCGRPGTQPVGSKPKGMSPYGAHDMAGNVWEWVADWYAEDAYMDTRARDPQGPAGGSERVDRGGSFFEQGEELRVTRRSSGKPSHAEVSLGFRCAK